MGRGLGSFVVCVGLLSLLACGGGGGGEVIRVPTLVSSSPADGATGVAPDTVIDLFWEQDLVLSTVGSHIELLAPSGNVSVSMGYDPATRLVRIAPDDLLLLGTRYHVHVSPGLQAADGQTLAAPYDIYFRIREATFQSPLLLETEAVDTASLAALALNRDGVGFAIWTQSPAAGNDTLWATPFDIETGPGTPFVLGTAAYAGTGPLGVAVNDAGDAIVAWETQDATDDTFARVYDAGTDTWSALKQLNTTPGETARAARVGIAANGDALVVWSQEAGFAMPDDLWYRRYTSAGWSGEALLETTAGDAAGVALAMHPDGRACVAWHQEAPTVYNIYARRLDPTGGGWSAVEPLEADDTTRAFSAQVEIAPNGDILVCWRQETGAPNSDERMWANHFVAGSGPGSGWQGETVLGGDPGDVRGWDLGMDDEGNAILVWHVYVNPYEYAYARRFLASGAWEDLVPLSGTSGDNIDSNTPVLAMNASGRAMAVWAQGDSLENKDVFARSFVPGVGWADIRTLDPEGLGYTPTPLVALDPEGNAIAAWSQGVYDTGGSYVRSDAWAHAYSPVPQWRGPALMETEEVESAFTLAVAMDRFGRGVVVWYQTRGGGSASDLYYRILR